MFRFLVAVLGADGAQALRKASEREPALLSYMLPRTALAWLKDVNEYEGTVPGQDNSYLSLKKSGTGFTGHITMPGDGLLVLGGKDDDVAVAAAISVSLGYDGQNFSGKDVTLVRLGKSIDALVGARDLTKKLLDPGAGYQISHEHHDLGDGKVMTNVSTSDSGGNVVGRVNFMHQGTNLVPGVVSVEPEHRRRGIAAAMYGHAEKQTGKKIVAAPIQTDDGDALWAGYQKQLGKVELPGLTHKPTQQQGPGAPAVPQKQGPAPRPRLPKMPGIKVSKSEAQAPCPECGGARFKADAFTGCLCWRALSKSIRTTAYGDGYVLEPGPDLSRETVLALMKEFCHG